MSDLACWRMRSLDEAQCGYVIHVHGSEHFMSQGEMGELMDMITAVFVHNTEEAFGADYVEMKEQAEAKPSGTDLLASLGLRREPLTIKRRLA